MYLNNIFELSMLLEADKFNRLMNKTYGNTECLDDNQYVDQSLLSKGIVVTYRDSQYKKKVQLTVNANAILDGDEPDKDNVSELIRKLEKRINKYFDFKYTLDDFTLAEMALTTDIDVRSRDKVQDYLKVIRRVGKVKGFSPPSDYWLDASLSFCLDGNSNGIEFWLYDLEGVLMERLAETTHDRKELKNIIGKSAGLIRAEVRLTKPKSIRVWTDETVTSAQLMALSKKSVEVFLNTFMRIVPFGDFYKKDRAIEIIRTSVKDVKLRQRMIHLVTLISEKKSLLLAQKALNYRGLDKIMEKFATIELSPVTLSKRHDIKKLDNIYKYM